MLTIWRCLVPGNFHDVLKFRPALGRFTTAVVACLYGFTAPSDRFFKRRRFVRHKSFQPLVLTGSLAAPSSCVTRVIAYSQGFPEVMEILSSHLIMQIPSLASCQLKHYIQTQHAAVCWTDMMFIVMGTLFALNGFRLWHTDFTFHPWYVNAVMYLFMCLSTIAATCCAHCHREPSSSTIWSISPYDIPHQHHCQQNCLDT